MVERLAVHGLALPPFRMDEPENGDLMPAENAAPQGVLHPDAGLVVDRVVVLEKEPGGVIRRLLRRSRRLGCWGSFLAAHAGSLPRTNGIRSVSLAERPS